MSTEWAENYYVFCVFFMHCLRILYSFITLFLIDLAKTIRQAMYSADLHEKVR